MQVVYKKSVTEKIYEAIHEAAEQNKEIEKIILTHDEWREFITSASMTGVRGRLDQGFRMAETLEYFGLLIEREKP